MGLTSFWSFWRGIEEGQAILGRPGKNIPWISMAACKHDYSNSIYLSIN
jgi:hypothetical protein